MRMATRALTGLIPVFALHLATARAESPDGGPPDSSTATAPDGGTATPAPADADADADAGTTPELTPEELAELAAATGSDSAAVKPLPEAPKGGGAGQSLNPDIAVITDVVLGWFNSDSPLQAGGHDPAENGFTLQQVELAIGKAVDPYFRMDANLVFGHEGVEVEEAFATTLALPHSLQLRAGQFLTRFGRLNSTHLHAWDFVDQPFALSRVFGGEGNRGVGAEVSWLTPLSWYVELVGSASEARGEGTTRSFLDEADIDEGSPLDFEYVLAAKQFFALSDNWSLAWGLSWATGPNPSGDSTRSDILGTDVFLKYRPITYGSHTVVSLQTEALYRRRQVPDDTLQDVNGYAQLFWRFAQRWGTAARYEYGTGAYDGGGTRVPDPLDPFWTGLRQRASAAITFWPTEFSRLRLQASADFLDWQDEPNLAAFLALEFNAGAHGAHAF